MTDEKILYPLSQRIIDKIVAEGHKIPKEGLTTEICGIHSCDDQFVCNEPFSNHTPPDLREQNCFNVHACSPTHTCSKPFGCSGDHLETENLGK